MGGGVLVSEDEIFSISGPHHLTNIDWNNSYHRTSVTSSLVKGVYTLERDRQMTRTGTTYSQAEAWWKSFHFSLHKPIYDDDSITAAIFEYNDQTTTSHSGIPPPRYVIAFRGTMLKKKTWFRDGLLDLSLGINQLHGDRYRKIIHEIETMVSRYGNEAIWLAGHSLGAGLALLVGKTMARSGFPLHAYLFNPPTASILLKVLKSRTLKFVVRIAGNIIRAAIVKATLHDKGEEEESFMRLAAWRPYLYVNPTDPICSEYIGYFEDRNKMAEMGLPVNLGTRYTAMNPFSSGGGEGGLSSEPLHILPSAYLMTNTNKHSKAHSIRQWWDPESIVKCELFQLDDLASSS